MKKILYLLLLIPALSFGQVYTFQYTGSANYHNQYRGGVGADITLKAPVTDASTVFGFDMKGLIRFNPTLSAFQYHDATQWTRLVDVAYGTANYKPLSYVPAWSEITSKPSFFSGAYADLTGKPTLFSGNYNDLSNKPTLFSGSYLDLTNKPTIPSYTAGTGISLALGVFTNTAPDQTVVLTAGNGITITGTYPNFTISASAPVPSIASRSLNSNFTVSSTKVAFVSYSVTCSVTNPLLVGTSSATAYLEYSINGGSSWLLPAQAGNSSGVGITVTVQLTNGQTGILSGMIPANALVRIRTATAGTSSVTYVTGQETLY